MDFGSTIIGTIIGGVLVWFLKPYLSKKAENIAIREDKKVIDRIGEAVRSEFSRQIAYETEKGKSAATKEDIEEITRKIEEIKNQSLIPIKLLELELGKKSTVHRLAAEYEFKSLVEIGKSLYRIKETTGNLRPSIDHIPNNQTWQERNNERFNEWSNCIKEFHHTIHQNRLVIPRQLYLRFTEILHFSRIESYEFSHSLKEDGTIPYEGYKSASENMKKLVEAIDVAIEEVHQRFDIKM